MIGFGGRRHRPDDEDLLRELNARMSELEAVTVELKQVTARIAANAERRAREETGGDA